MPKPTVQNKCVLGDRRRVGRLAGFVRANDAAQEHRAVEFDQIPDQDTAMRERRNDRCLARKRGAHLDRPGAPRRPIEDARLRRVSAGKIAFPAEEVESFRDQVIWPTDSNSAIASRWPQDWHVRVHVVQAIVSHERGDLGEQTFAPIDAQQILAIGRDTMMKPCAQRRWAYLRDR
jgi:hypothetical protein